MPSSEDFVIESQGTTKEINEALDMMGENEKRSSRERENFLKEKGIYETAAEAIAACRASGSQRTCLDTPKNREYLKRECDEFLPGTGIGLEGNDDYVPGSPQYLFNVHNDEEHQPSDAWHVNVIKIEDLEKKDSK